MPLKDWVTMIDLWLIVISIPCFQNKSACLPPLKADSGVLKENSGDAERFSAFDMSSKSHSNEESQTSEDESPQASYHELFGAPVMDALQQKG